MRDTASPAGIEVTPLPPPHLASARTAPIANIVSSLLSIATSQIIADSHENIPYIGYYDAVHLFHLEGHNIVRYVINTNSNRR